MQKVFLNFTSFVQNHQKELTAVSALQIVLSCLILFLSALIVIFYLRKLKKSRFHYLMFSLISASEIMLIAVSLLAMIGVKITLQARSEYGSNELNATIVDDWSRTVTRLVYAGTFLLWGALQAIGIAVNLFVVQYWLVAKKLTLAVTSS